MAKTANPQSEENLVPRSVARKMLIDLREKPRAMFHEPITSTTKSTWETLAQDYLRRSFGASPPNTAAVMDVRRYRYMSGDKDKVCQRERAEDMQERTAQLHALIELVEGDLAMQVHRWRVDRFREAKRLFSCMVTKVAHSCAIYEEYDGWSGNTEIAGDGIDSPARTAVAIEGCVAEAKRAAIDITPEQNVITITDDVVTTIFDYVTQVWEDKNNRREALAQKVLAGPPLAEEMPTPAHEPIGRSAQLWVATIGQQAESAISRGDALRRTLSYRTKEQIQMSLGSVADICNDPRGGQ